MGTDPGTHARELGMDWVSIRRGHSTVAVATLADVDPLALDNVTVRLGAERGQPREHWARFRGASYGFGLWRASLRRCVACDAADIREFGETCGRWWYDLLLIDRCPDHGHTLVDRCPSCGDRVATGPRCCYCGLDLVAATAAKSAEQGAWAHYLVRHFDGGERPAVPALDSLSTFQAIKLATLIGRMAPRRPGDSRIDPERGYLALRSGPEGLAKKTKFAQPREGWAWEMIYFGALTMWLKQTDEPGRVVVAQMARDFVAARTPEGLTVRVYGEAVHGHRRLTSR